ncbi:hypothetical protein M1555_01345 [Patescibacteria group bacterium]|nr:hypothetical protein [Patescibacteria group bacterium]
MFKNLLLYVKYPSVAGIIGTIWVGSGVMVLRDPSLPILTMVKLNILASVVIGMVGFRVEKK